MMFGLTKVASESTELLPRTREPHEHVLTAVAHDARGAISGAATERSKERKGTKFQQVS